MSNPYEKLEPSVEDRQLTSDPVQPPSGPSPPLYPQTYPPAYQQSSPNQPYQQQAYPPQGYGSPAGFNAPPPPAQYVRVVGGCPKCGGIMQEDFTCLGICCAVVFFPIGLLCCLLMKEKKCSNCGWASEQ